MDHHPDLNMNAAGAVSSSAAAITSSSASTSASVKRACDACHRRKVKCDGINPCRNCSTAQLTCTYHAIPQKKGPKGSRAKVISELRETQRHTTVSAKAAARLPCTSNLAPTPGLLGAAMLQDCVDFYFAHVYPTLPILSRARVEQQLLYVDQNAESYCLLAALCAFVLLQPGMGAPADPSSSLADGGMPGANLMTSTMLVEEALRVRKNYDHTEAPGLSTLCTSYFLYACHHALDLHNKAWYHLREATTLALIMGMQKEESYLQCDVVEASRRRRLYWLLFIAERAYALQRQRPMSLTASIALPTQTDDPAESHCPPLHKFVNLASLYQPFDESLITLWNKTRHDCSPSYMAALQKQLSDAVPGYLAAQVDVAADLDASQQWLRTMVWQFNMQNNGEENMQFQYSDLMTMTAQFSQQNMGSQGALLIEKMFSTSCTLMEHLAGMPTNPGAFTFALSPREHLHQFQTLLSILRNGDTRFLPLLLTKVHDVLPLMANPMLPAAPRGLPNPAADIDIFDGFGSAGMDMSVASAAASSSFPRLTIPTHAQQEFNNAKMDEQLLSPSGTSDSANGAHSQGSSSASYNANHVSVHALHHQAAAHASQSPAYASPHPGLASPSLDMDFSHLGGDFPDAQAHAGFDAGQHHGGHQHPFATAAASEFKQEFDVDSLAGLHAAPTVSTSLRRGGSILHGHMQQQQQTQLHAQHRPRGPSRHASYDPHQLHQQQQQQQQHHHQQHHQQHQHHHLNNHHHHMHPSTSAAAAAAMAMNLTHGSVPPPPSQTPRSVPEYVVALASTHGHPGIHGLDMEMDASSGSGGGGGGTSSQSLPPEQRLDYMAMDFR